MRRFPYVQQDAADQEAGENEEQVHAAPADSKCREKTVRPETQGGMVRITNVVAENDKKDGKASEAVELRDAAEKIWCGWPLHSDDRLIHCSKSLFLNGLCLT